MSTACRIVTTFTSGLQRQSDWMAPEAVRQMFEVAATLAASSAEVVAVDLETRHGVEGRIVLRYQRDDDGSLVRLQSDQIEQLRRAIRNGALTLGADRGIENALRREQTSGATHSGKRRRR